MGLLVKTCSILKNNSKIKEIPNRKTGLNLSIDVDIRTYFPGYTIQFSTTQVLIWPSYTEMVKVDLDLFI